MSQNLIFLHSLSSIHRYLFLFFSLIIHGKLSFVFFLLSPARVVHPNGLYLVRFPLCAQALTPPFELFVNAILSSHAVMRFLQARGESLCNKNSSSNYVVHNKSFFRLAADGRKKLTRSRIYGTRRKIGHEKDAMLDTCKRDRLVLFITRRIMRGVEWFISETTRNVRMASCRLIWWCS